jgi:hypothetical protein
VLDGVRPYYIEAISPETAAFHEFIGDLTAILISFRNNEFRNFVARKSQGDLNRQIVSPSNSSWSGRGVRSGVDRRPVKPSETELMVIILHGRHRVFWLNCCIEGGMVLSGGQR